MKGLSKNRQPFRTTNKTKNLLLVRHVLLYKGVKLFLNQFHHLSLALFVNSFYKI
jgi:hypothetical protein